MPTAFPHSEHVTISREGTINSRTELSELSEQNVPSNERDFPVKSIPGHQRKGSCHQSSRCPLTPVQEITPLRPQLYGK